MHGYDLQNWNDHFPLRICETIESNLTSIIAVLAPPSATSVPALVEAPMRATIPPAD
jgi:hypothetical protein